ncbi:MAG: hypothetical protein ACFFDI_13010 [Promethearchaeota archaeon]
MSENQSNIRGTCGNCRHANHGTMDAEDGFWACPWLGATRPEFECLIKYKDTGEYVYEPFDGNNCTWGSTGSIWRSVPKGYQKREVIIAKDDKT